jgi:hypothetical protein
MSGRPLKASSTQFAVFDLGLTPYPPLQALQGRLRAAVADGRLPGSAPTRAQPSSPLEPRGRETWDSGRAAWDQ